MKRLKDYQRVKIEYDPVSFEEDKDFPPTYLERSVHRQITLQVIMIAALLVMFLAVIFLIITYLLLYAPNN